MNPEIVRIQDWNAKVTRLVERKGSFLEEPGKFVARVAEVAEIFTGSYQDTFLEATVALTGGMRPEELSWLTDTLKITWGDAFSKLPDENPERRQWQTVTNCLMVCQEVRKVNCLRPNTDDGDTLR